MNPKISIFTSSYNYSKYLRKSIESVLSQTYTNFEYLLYNDGSTDDTHQIMKEYADDKRIKIIKLGEHLKIGALINKSIKLSTGNYWSWCPADDYWQPNLLEEKIKYIKRYPKSVLYDSFYYINSDGEIYGQHDFNDISAEEYAIQAWNVCEIAFTGILLPLYIFNKYGLFFPEISWIHPHEDFYWMMEAICNEIPFNLVPQRLHFKRMHLNPKYSQAIKYQEEIDEKVIKIRNELRKKYEILGWNK